MSCCMKQIYIYIKIKYLFGGGERGLFVYKDFFLVGIGTTENYAKSKNLSVPDQKSH